MNRFERQIKVNHHKQYSTLTNIENTNYSNYEQYDQNYEEYPQQKKSRSTAFGSTFGHRSG